MDTLRRHGWEGFSDFVVGRGEMVAAVREREDERWRRARSLGILGTAVLHVIILLLVRGVEVEPQGPVAAAGPAAGDLRAAAGGGSGLTMVEVRPQQAPAEQPEEVIEPVPEPEEIIIPDEIVVASPEPAPTTETFEAPSLPGVGTAGAGGQDGPATGPGTATGTGDGGGGTGDQGASRVIPPTPRGIFIPPPGQPASARGQEITVWVFVTANGRVDRDQIRLEPPTSDSRYNRRLMQSVAEWVFDPAREDGRPVPVWYPFQIVL